MKEIKIYIRPFFEGPNRGEGGIRRWVECQRAMLPEHGIFPTLQEAEAEIVATHAGDVVNTLKPLVVHNHGLYNTAAQAWSRFEFGLNKSVIENLRRAAIVTCPSEWVHNQLARGMSIDARVMYGGIDAEMWEPGTNEGHILWNKTRVDPVCDPSAVTALAAANPTLQFVSTFGPKLPNVKLTGRLPYEEARDLIRHAAVYLCTTRETFGIGTIEAMASGVPVVGWAFGGQVDIVKQGETGYLAKVGDYAELQAGLHAVLARRNEMGMAAREDVLSRFSWRRSIAHCAAIYREVAAQNVPRPKASIIVTVYELERFLPACLDSLIAQSSRDWECVVVDDCSPGNCGEIVADYAAKDSRFRYVRTPHNLYLPGARNFGINQASGKYIIPLDADDMLADKAIEILSEFLDKQPGYGIAYGAMEVIEEGKRPFVSGWPPEFSWDKQMSLRPDGIANQNQLPYCAMYRREVWQRVGGYKERCQTSEDNDFWCRVSSFGYRAHKVSSYPTLIYRNRPESMSYALAWPDCTLWYPWARKRDLTPFGSVGEPPNHMSWPVKTYAEPDVSVVIPVGPGHEEVVKDALDSVLAQTTDVWECILVNDTGKPLTLPGFAWARTLATPEPGSGPAAARNVGISAARAPLFALLDADDYLMPQYLERMLAVQRQHGGYVYSDWYEINKGGEHQRKQTPEFDIMDLLYKGLPWAVTSLFAKADWETVGGFDPGAQGWEDWDFFFNLATHGICGTRVAEPLWCYRYLSGQRREKAYATSKANAAMLKQKWAAWTARKGVKLMGCRGCGGGGGGKASSQAPAAQQQISRREVTIAEATQSGAVLMEYVGKSAGTMTLRGIRSGQTYRAGPDSGHNRIFVYAVDVPQFLGLPFLRVVETPRPIETVADKPLQVRQSSNRIADAVAG